MKLRCRFGLHPWKLVANAMVVLPFAEVPAAAEVRICMSCDTVRMECRIPGYYQDTVDAIRDIRTPASDDEVTRLRKMSGLE